MRVNLRKSLFILPNAFTLSSVLCGFYAILICTPDATNEDFYRASLLLVFAMFFDTIDGRVARLTNTQSAIGLQLDSLADVISFGVAPAVLVFRWSLEAIGNLGIFFAFVYIACGTVRLARFNVLATAETGAPKTPGKYIVGLPIPAAAGILVALVVANTVTGKLPGSPAVVSVVVLALAFFMVSTVRFRSFKDLKLSWRTGVFVAFAVGSTAFIAIQFHISIALVWMLTTYIVIGIAEALFNLAKNLRHRGKRVPDEGSDQAEQE